MARQRGTYPCNMQEFMDQGWTNEIRYRIRVFNLKDSLNNPEDLVQDILLSLITTNYVVRYSKDKGPFSTYIYGFIDNFLKKRYNKENTRHGKFIVSAASLICGSPEADTDFNGREVYTDLLDSGEDLERQILVNTTIEEIRRELAENFEANSEYTDEDGVLWKRDPLTVFNLMMEGKTVKDVAKTLNVSKQFVYHLIGKIKQSQAARDFLENQ